MTVRCVKPGELVRSQAGRDGDKHFIVLNILDPDYLLIADGHYRKVENPKKKKIKHLRCTGLVATEIGEMLQQGKTPANAQVSGALRRLLETLETGS
ncbi:RNA-binding protein [Heliobacterium undosum]|uniref:RNA-binding protein n=1 Tax=Heliomicrobium undosum TaxID=121734 RepID=A0A845L3J5_9FIRM|nr:KOW domain-containing RNA-binding protein [Heliomicrobium undosum]MZP30276.1 RNA-binding protein [Heliomicrobium undosum]